MLSCAIIHWLPMAAPWGGLKWDMLNHVGCHHEKMMVMHWIYSHEYLGQPMKLHLELPSYRQGKWDPGWLSCLPRSHRLSCIQTHSPVLSPAHNFGSHSLCLVSTGFWLRAQRRGTEVSGDFREGFWAKRRQWGKMKEEGWMFVSKKAFHWTLWI